MLLILGVGRVKNVACPCRVTSTCRTAFPSSLQVPELNVNQVCSAAVDEALTCLVPGKSEKIPDRFLCEQAPNKLWIKSSYLASSQILNLRLFPRPVL